jgi:peptidoglycan/xylan/chitin deacetylase (PgdA/CDA1 family)
MLIQVKTILNFLIKMNLVFANILICMLLTAAIFYWKPKSLVIKGLNWSYPEILTHNIPNKQTISAYEKHSVANMSLTFDDAPYKGTESLKEIVNILDEADMKGTFFVIAGQVNDASKKILVDMVKNGHQLGNHGVRDVMHYKLSIEDLRKEFIPCDRLIRDIYEEANVQLPSKMLYRPGSGLFHKKMFDLCKEFGYTLTLGSVYPEDPKIRSPYINYLYTKYHIKENDIVILHDRKWTPNMLRPLMIYMKSKNLKSVTVDELIN